MKMRITGKVVAGVLGFLSFGVAGLLFGLVLGHAFDRGLWRALQLAGPESADLKRKQFFETTYTLLGFVAKADGHVSEAEIAQAEGLFFQLQLDPEQRREAIKHFQFGTSAGFDPAATIAQFSECIGPRRQAQHTLLSFLVSIAIADGTLSSSERDAVYKVAELFSLSRVDVDRLITMLLAQSRFQERSYRRTDRPDSDHQGLSELAMAYKALGLEASTSDANIKRRYRKLMSENHPDKLIAEGVPDELLRVATERSQEISAAYQVIQKTRGLR